ncbi:hypothetical protein [Acidimangrovimonas sediminis]|uniref:hypothetical protein n=1 Tax=Acidimangrovimonas sediminis TaxID=2056283 RepID=UPI000C7FB025|nr:hypothetical protein [Acidimangrovimonas sediminis]
MTDAEEKRHARLIAAYAVLGVKGIARDRITVDKWAVPYLDRKEVAGEDRLRITLLSLCLLECIASSPSGKMEILLEAPHHRSYRAGMRWLEKHFGGRRLTPYFAEFLAPMVAVP